ncbi:MAG TPA: hypothetical protein VNT22_07165 [Baekduia sp.]|nr:hypothetical protein [Baekduia sp.]
MEGGDDLVAGADGSRKRIWWDERDTTHAGKTLLSNARLGEFEGIPIVLMSVVLGEADVAVHLA